MSNNLKESKIERYLCNRVAAMGGVAEKVTVLGSRGFFDRLVVLPGGRIILIELKRPSGGRLSAHQQQRIARYRALGAVVALAKTEADIDAILES